MYKTAIYVLISIVLVVLGTIYYTVTDVIIELLELLIVLEIVRMIANFISDSNHKINLRYAVDGSIIYVLRELYITLTQFRVEPDLYLQIGVYILVIISFVLMRSIVIKQQGIIFKDDC